MKKPETDTCECGRPEVGPAHCPVHGDGNPQAPAPDSRSRPAATRPPGRPRRVKKTPS
jgi:hypothetical protein